LRKRKKEKEKKRKIREKTQAKISPLPQRWVLPIRGMRPHW
jgi:hypothetical protein